MKKSYLKTDFRKFILEKLHGGKQTTPDELEEVEPDDIEEPTEDGEPDEEIEDELNDDVVEELLNEYKKIKRKHELHKLHRRRK